MRSRRSIHNKDPDDDLSRIPDNYNDCLDDKSESDDEPLLQPSRKSISKRPSKVSFTSTLGTRVLAIQLTLTLVHPLRDLYWEACIDSEEEDKRDPAPLESKNISD